jgi:hypothetical protein
MTHLTNIYTLQVIESIEKATSLVLAQPFESARLMYAWAVRFGLFENSLLDSSRFSRDISFLEKVTLGPWARQL